MTGKADDSGFQYACGASVICDAAWVMEDGDCAEILFHVMPDNGSGTIPLSGRKSPAKGPVAMTRPPFFTNSRSRLRSSALRALDGSARMSVAPTASGSSLGDCSHRSALYPDAFSSR